MEDWSVGPSGAGGSPEVGRVEAGKYTHGDAAPTTIGASHATCIIKFVPNPQTTAR